jgi:mandelamide amidase
MPLTTSGFDQVGPLARTVEDLALFDSVVSGDGSPLPVVDLKGVRIGVADFFFADLDSEVERVAQLALDRLRDAGAIIVRAEVSDDVKAAPDVAFAINRFELQSAISGFLAGQGMRVSYDDLVAQVGPNLKIFATPVPPKEVYDAMVVQRQKIRDAIRAHFENENIVALAFPPAMIPPHKIEEDGSTTVRGEQVPSTTTMGRNISLSSLASLASLVLPAGLTASGLPIGLEFDALPGTDRKLLGLGVALQRALGSIQAPQV